MRWHGDLPLRNRVLGAGARAVFRFINRRFEWHRLPLHVSLLNLDMFRFDLRRANLIDTDQPEAPPRARPVPPVPDEEERISRSFEGTNNDLSFPMMGSVGQAFGRNIAPDYRPRQLRHAQSG